MTKARDLANASTALSAVSATELGYVDGVTSAIQTQLDAKAPSSTAVTLTGTQTLTNKTLTSPVISSVINNTLTSTTGDIIYASAANTPARLGIGTTGQILNVSGGIPAWTTAASSGAMTQIADTTLTSAAADITFSSIPSTYNHLKVVISGAAASVSYNGCAFYVQMNGDTATNYSYSRNTKYATPGGTVTIEGSNTQSQIELGTLWAGQAVANSIAAIDMTFFNYKLTTLHKAMTFTGGSFTDAPGAGSGWGRWKNTAAVTSIKLYSDAGNLMTGTRATLYGWT